MLSFALNMTYYLKQKDEGEKIMKTCKKMGRPTKRPEKELLMILYSRHTAHELATMYDVSDSTVRSWVCRLRKE